ncbi:hypothetical protein AUR64_19235 [Haloprofundus marisrubri]|uniref:Uncharacterized protein n=1 Tax=Haloprofundus marisrubri TaxID=1514971 RepID=A0A0W1R5J9_9EURY|nr:hypothetical protein [Haloprofundus marisrubri]KTG08367.1 hypothetical protein AUR64_19235 [Haloprofundus marisrubri]
MDRRPSTWLAIGLAVGVVAGFTLGSGALASAFAASDDDELDDPFTSVSRSGATCYDGPTPNAGWLHEGANGHYYGVTLNATVVHAPDKRLDAVVKHVSEGRYVVALRTVAPDDDEDSWLQRKDDSCDRVSTHVELATSLPTDEYREVTVTANGRELLVVERDGTVAELYQLPNPVNTTA